MTNYATSNDGTSIAWYDLGGDGPDLLLAHATGFCGRIWEPVANILQDSFHCVAFDLRGHGLSSSPTGPAEKAWNWDRYAQDAKAVIEASGIINPFGVGHSCGGATEILLEESVPGTFKALYLFEPVIFIADPPTGPDPERDLAVRTRKRRPTFDSRQKALETFGSKGPFVNLDRRCLENYVDYGFETRTDGTLKLRCEPDDEAEVYVMASAHNAYGRLESVKCSATIAYGEKSDAFTESHMQNVANRMPNAQFAQWPELGHFGPLEAPEQFAKTVKSWFDTSCHTA